MVDVAKSGEGVEDGVTKPKGEVYEYTADEKADILKRCDPVYSYE